MGFLFISIFYCFSWTHLRFNPLQFLTILSVPLSSYVVSSNSNLKKIMVMKPLKVITEIFIISNFHFIRPQSNMYSSSVTQVQLVRFNCSVRLGFIIFFKCFFFFNSVLLQLKTYVTLSYAEHLCHCLSCACFALFDSYTKCTDLKIKLYS